MVSVKTIAYFASTNPNLYLFDQRYNPPEIAMMMENAKMTIARKESSGLIGFGGDCSCCVEDELIFLFLHQQNESQYAHFAM
jgi:hypothetical protein